MPVESSRPASKGEHALSSVSKDGAPPAGVSLPHPLKLCQDFLTSHCLRSTRSCLALYQVHEDLRLVRCWSALRVVNAETPYLFGVAPNGFDSVFPNAADTLVDRTQAVVPMTTDIALTPRIMSTLCSSIVHPETRATFRCITVAIVDRDSTTAYYRVFNKFEEIVDLQWKQKKARSVGAGGGLEVDAANVIASDAEDNTDESGSSSGDDPDSD